MNNSQIILINESNLNTGIEIKEHQLIHANFYWHKIFVRNATKYSASFVLRTIMDAVHPLDFIPVCYKIEGEYATFLLKNCGPAILKLCKLNLTIPHPDANLKLPPFKIAFALKHSHASELKIDIQTNILAILRKRYHGMNRTLDLDCFIKDPDLIEFCPLSQSKLLYFVLHLSREFDVEVLKLNENEITTLKPLEALNNDRFFKSLAAFEFRKNRLRDASELAALRPFPLTTVYLEDNPICENLSEQDYINLVRQHCPKIDKIDGVRVPSPGLLLPRRNFLCHPTAHDFADQFIEHYFTLYDSANRGSLMNMYHPQCLLSITTDYGVDQSGASLRLYEYKKLSRNLITLSDILRNKEYLFYGAVQVNNILTNLPTVEHDPYSFSVDVMKFTEEQVILSVSGTFREAGKKQSYFSFMRTFILGAASHMEWQITNDMVHISIATLTQQVHSGNELRVIRSPFAGIPTAVTPFEQLEMTNALAAITSLEASWAKKCLTEAKFDFKQALALFLDLVQANKLPANAFHIRPDDLLAEEPKRAIPKLMAMEAEPVAPPPPSLSAKEIAAGPSTSVKAPRKSPSGKSSADFSRPIKDEDFLSSNTAYIRFISDKVLRDAFDLNPETPMEVARERLMKAKHLILSKYTLAINYYKAVALELYKFQLFDEARQFFKDGMAKLPKANSEKLYLLHVLYETEYGDLSNAETMILDAVEKQDAHDVVSLMNDQLGKLDTSFVRKLYENIAVMNIDFDIRSVYLSGFVDFENDYGHAMNMKKARDLRNRLMQQKSSSKSSRWPTAKEDCVQVIEMKVDSPEEGECDDLDSDIPLSKHVQKYDVNFEAFRTKYLIASGFLPEKVDCAKLKVLESTASVTVAVELSKDILEEFPENVFLIRSVFYVLHKFGKHEMIGNYPNFNNYSAIATIKYFFSILPDIESNNLRTLKWPLLQFMRHQTIADYILLLEELMSTVVPQNLLFFEDLFKELCNGSKFDVTVLIFRTFCRRHGLDTAEILFNINKIATNAVYYPPEFNNAEWSKVYRKKYENVEKVSADVGNQFNNLTSFEVVYEKMRFYFYTKSPNAARKLKNKFALKDIDDKTRFKLQLAHAYFENKYGARQIAFSILRKLAKTGSVAIIQLLDCVRLQLHKLNSDDLDLCFGLFTRAELVMDPVTQELLYKYQKQWTAEGFDIFEFHVKYLLNRFVA